MHVVWMDLADEEVASRFRRRGERQILDSGPGLDVGPTEDGVGACVALIEGDVVRDG